jgi:hypothetical protein
MERWWNDTEVEENKSKYKKTNLSRSHFVNHKSHMDWLKIESGPKQWQYKANKHFMIL